MSFSPTRMMKAMTVADAADVDYFEIPEIPAVRRKCQGNGCSTVLRQSNRGTLCSVCDRKRFLQESQQQYRGLEQEQEHDRWAI
jgi:hypothetical protein